jgi:hypothetical protein
VDHPIGNFVDGAVAAGGENEVSATADAVGGQRGGRARSLCGNGFDFVTRIFQDAYGCIEPAPAAAAETSRVGVIDKIAAAVVRDG